MKVRKIGRDRPVLYGGKFRVPLPVIKRLAASKNHFILAQIANFNGKIDQYYLTIDNILSAVIVAREGTLTTTNHRRKITKFFRYLRRRTRIRSIDESDFHGFYDLWSKSRYSLYFPKSSETEKIMLFTSHLLEFAITEIARLFKSDETILAQKVDELLEVYESEAIQEEAEIIHQYRQMEGEELGEMYGGRLGMKLTNRWNFIDVSLLTDRKEILEIADGSEDIRTLLVETLKNWDQLVSTIQGLIFKRVALEIANAKMKRRAIDPDVAMEESMEAAAKHPRAQFRLTLNSTYDPSGPKRTAAFFTQTMKALDDMRKNPNKAIMTGWEIYKKYS